jgi:hypothetical protein
MLFIIRKQALAVEAKRKRKGANHLQLTDF